MTTRVHINYANDVPLRVWRFQRFSLSVPAVSPDITIFTPRRNHFPRYYGRWKIQRRSCRRLLHSTFTWHIFDFQIHVCAHLRKLAGQRFILEIAAKEANPHWCRAIESHSRLGIPFVWCSRIRWIFEAFTFLSSARAVLFIKLFAILHVAQLQELYPTES